MEEEAEEEEEEEEEALAMWEAHVSASWRLKAASGPP